MNQRQALKQISELAPSLPGVEVLWLYGSRARGDASAHSDYDLAVALVEGTDTDLVAEKLYTKTQGLLGAEVSLVDINKIPTTLAINVIEDGQVLFCGSDLRLHTEESRIWSKWEQVAYEAKRFPNEL